MLFPLNQQINYQIC